MNKHKICECPSCGEDISDSYEESPFWSGWHCFECGESVEDEESEDE